MTPRPRLLAIMGSGETAPTMARVHRLLVERLGAPPVDAVLLDSPYCFQENAGEISLRTVSYFRNLQIPFDVCYLGERRLGLMESMLDADTVLLGVDEHTAALFDLDADTVTVLGRATLTVRRQAMRTAFASGAIVALDELREIAAGGGSTRRSANTQPATAEATSPTPSLRAEAERLEHVTRLAEIAVLGARDPRDIVAPFVEALLELREQAREQGSWTLADTLRDRLTTAGIEVRDTPQGTTWLLAGSPDSGLGDRLQPRRL